ncbi:MAG TPA: flagellar basal-body MS-ring/collar protein FliF [Terriglobales bacterium]|nr:flagellar basal-body MS-ring/collar protein FliF [Terriglobales bacterium]
MEEKEANLGLKEVREFVAGLSLTQRMTIVGGALLVGITLWLFVRLIGQPDYRTLYSGLKPDEARSLGEKLAGRNIRYEISPDGASVLVPSDRLDQARLETAAQGLPKNGRLGFEIFDSPNWLGTEFTEKVNYQRALEGELERTLASLSEVQAVRVHLVLPQESLFSERERQGKAAVILKTRSGRLSSETQFGIAQLVASAVDGIRPENVTIMDADGNYAVLAGIGDSTGAFAGSAHDLGEQLASRLVATLTPVVGPGRVRAAVRVEYDMSSSEDTQETYDPKSAVAVTMQRSEESSGGVAAGGVPGTASNVPGAAGAGATVAANTQDRQSSHSESGTYVVSRLVRHTVQPAGRLRRIAAAVLIDDALESKTENGQATQVRRKRTPEELKNIEQLAAAAIGVDSSRGDLLAVENLSFQETAPEAPAPPSRMEQVRVHLVRWSGVLRYGAVALLFMAVYLAMLRPIKKQVLAAFRELPTRLARAKLAPEPEPGEPGTPPIIEATGREKYDLPEQPAEARRFAGLKRQLAEKVKVEPAAASRLVESWIQDSE